MGSIAKKAQQSEIAINGLKKQTITVTAIWELCT